MTFRGYKRVEKTAHSNHKRKYKKLLPTEVENGRRWKAFHSSRRLTIWYTHYVYLYHHVLYSELCLRKWVEDWYPIHIKCELYWTDVKINFSILIPQYHIWLTSVKYLLFFLGMKMEGQTKCPHCIFDLWEAHM